MTISYPNESADYRSKRNQLLEAELELRQQLEEVAGKRRTLPPGGLLKEDYLFAELVAGREVSTRFSDLFDDGKDTLFLYSFMYAPDMEAACPGCTALLDGLDAQVRHIQEHINIAVVAKHSLAVIHEHADRRGWSQLRMLSSARNTFNVDYYGEIDGDQITIANVFVRGADGIRHFWGAEMTHASMIGGGDMRHLDLIWPLWNVLDLTPNGRPDWHPKLDYSN